MNPAVLCIGRSAERWNSLKTDGYEVLHACDEVQAVELLRSQTVNVVCIDSRSMPDDAESSVGTNLRNISPRVPVVLVQSGSSMPLHYEQQVDVVIDEAGFEAIGRWLIGELHEVRFPLFVQWFEDWKQSRIQSSGETAVHTC